MPQHELLACAQCGCFAFSCFEDFAIRVNPYNMPELYTPLGYVGAIGIMALIALGQVLYFRRLGFLGRGKRR